MPDAPPETGGRVVRRALRRNARRLACGYPLILLWQLCETSVPVVIGVVVDRGIAPRDASGFAWSALLLVGVMTTLSYSYRFGSRFIVRALLEEEHALRHEVAAHVLHPRGARTSSLPGETLALATGDAEMVSLVLRQLAFAIAALLSVVVVAVYVLGVDVVLGLLILVGVPAIMLLIQVVTPVVARRTGRQQESVAATSGLASDLLHGLRPLKGIGGEDVAVARYRRASATARDHTIATARSWGVLAGLTVLLSGILLAGVTVVAGRRALDGDISLGQLIALVGLTQFLAEPLRGIGDFSAQFGGSLASARRIAAFLASPRLAAGGDAAPTDPAAGLTLDAVESGPLRGLTLRVRPDEMVGVVVDDPSAADVVVELLAAERVADGGSVRLGGTPVETLSTAARRAALVVSPHDAEVFEGPLRDTVDPDHALTTDALDTALTASGAAEVVALHPDGLERHVRDRGTSLSGGQRQRLALARALAADAPLLVLHDPTSAVDAVTEQAVADGVGRVRGGRATLVLTSSPALLARADRVVVVRAGRVAADGRHEDLMADDAYREQVLR